MPNYYVPSNILYFLLKFGNASVNDERSLPVPIPSFDNSATQTVSTGPGVQNKKYHFVQVHTKLYVTVFTGVFYGGSFFLIYNI